MAKSENNSSIYIRDENLTVWKLLKEKSGFVNYCLKHHLLDYKKWEADQNFGVNGVKNNLPEMEKNFNEIKWRRKKMENEQTLHFDEKEINEMKNFADDINLKETDEWHAYNDYTDINIWIDEETNQKHASVYKVVDGWVDTSRTCLLF